MLLFLLLFPGRRGPGGAEVSLGRSSAAPHAWHFAPTQLGAGQVCQQEKGDPVEGAEHAGRRAGFRKQPILCVRHRLPENRGPSRRPPRISPIAWGRRRGVQTFPPKCAVTSNAVTANTRWVISAVFSDIRASDPNRCSPGARPAGDLRLPGRHRTLAG